MKHFSILSFLFLMVLGSSPYVSAEHEHGRRYQKPGAPVYMVGQSQYQLIANNEQNVEIKLQAASLGGKAIVHIEVDAGLENLSAQTQWDFDLSETKNLTIPLSVLAAQDGRYFIHVFTTIEDTTGRAASRAQAVVIDVGEQNRKLFRYTGQYIVLPSNEEIY